VVVLIVALVLAVVLVVTAGSFFVTSRRAQGRLKHGAPRRPDLKRPAVPETGKPESGKASPTKERPSGSPVPGAPAATEAPVAADAAHVPETPVAPEAPVPFSFAQRLGKARGLLAPYLSGMRGQKKLDKAQLEELEEALLLADVGVETTTALLRSLQDKMQETVSKQNEIISVFQSVLVESFQGRDRSLELKPSEDRIPVWLFVGVNGAGKTTTIAKVTRRLQNEGKKVVLAAGDTFRAAAVEQLATWAERTGAEIVKGQEGGDPAAVVFDAIGRAKATGADIVLADTAGRLHTKSNLMEELAKVRRVADRPPGEVLEVLLVLDATTGQNGMAQARQFTEAAKLTGVVLTKLDGTAKGGIVIAVERELGLPVKLVGLGERLDDLVEFDPQEFVTALLSF
jgi:fused signal recognition particle receptor